MEVSISTVSWERDVGSGSPMIQMALQTTAGTVHQTQKHPEIMVSHGVPLFSRQKRDRLIVFFTERWDFQTHQFETTNPNH